MVLIVGYDIGHPTRNAYDQHAGGDYRALWEEAKACPVANGTLHKAPGGKSKRERESNG